MSVMLRSRNLFCLDFLDHDPSLSCDIKKALYPSPLDPDFHASLTEFFKSIQTGSPPGGRISSSHPYHNNRSLIFSLKQKEYNACTGSGSPNPCIQEYSCNFQYVPPVVPMSVKSVSPLHRIRKHTRRSPVRVTVIAFSALSYLAPPNYALQKSYVQFHVIIPG